MDSTSMEMKRENFDRNMELETKFQTTIKSILGNQFITKDITADLKEATDFAIFTVNPFRVGVRLRRYDYYKNPKYRKQFTIRCAFPSGCKTEIHKIKEGLVEYILYGFVNETETKIIQYFIGDIKVFNKINPQPYKTIPNKRKWDSSFHVYQLSQFPTAFIIKDWHI